MEEQRFLEAMQAVEREDVKTVGIGTLSEKLLHAVLKRYYAPDASFCEVQVGRYIADVFDGKRIVEIQTRNFAYLRPKLKSFLQQYPVTLVYPLPRIRYLIWTDPETGEFGKPRKCGKQGNALCALHELYQIMPFLTHENLTVELLLFDLDEYRLLDGWSRDRKKGATRVERIPRGTPTCFILKSAADYRTLLPENLPACFTVSVFRKLTKLQNRPAYSAIHVLESLGVVVRDGLDGRAAVYRLVQT